MPVSVTSPADVVNLSLLRVDLGIAAEMDRLCGIPTEAHFIVAEGNRLFHGEQYILTKPLADMVMEECQRRRLEAIPKREHLIGFLGFAAFYKVAQSWIINVRLPSGIIHLADRRWWRPFLLLPRALLAHRKIAGRW